MAGSVFLLCLYAACLVYGLGCLLFFLRREQATDACLLSGLLLHTSSQLARGWYLGIFVPNAVLEALFFLPWSMAALAAVSRWIGEDRRTAQSLLLPVLAFCLLAAFAPKGIFPPSPRDQTVFATVFFLTEVLAHACFILGAWLGLRFLLAKSQPQYFHRFVIWGFVSYSAAQIVGAIWCYLGWSAPLNWSPRHLQSASLWCFYAAFLHLRFLPKWPVTRRAWFAVAGAMLVIVFCYSGQLAETGMKIGG